MTFRSFSRFVRWYRWPLLLIAGCVALGFALELLGSPRFLVFYLPFSPITVFGVLSFLLVYDGKSEVRRRMRRRQGHAEDRERARLRSQPLRGWTK